MAGIIERGVVAKTHERGVDVRMEHATSAGCGNCGQCSSAGGDVVMLDVADTVGVRIGDLVEVELPEGARLRASALSYGLPILGLLAGYMAGFLLGSALALDADAIGAVTASAAAVVTFFIGRGWSVSTMERDRFRPRVRAIISPSGEVSEVDRCCGGSNQ